MYGAWPITAAGVAFGLAALTGGCQQPPQENAASGQRQRAPMSAGDSSNDAPANDVSTTTEAETRAGRNAAERALVLFRQGQTVAAAPWFVEALRRAPRDAELHHRWAICLHQRGDSATALAHFTEAAGLAPLDATVHANRGLALLAAGDAAKAAVSLREAVRLAPQNLVAANNLAWTLASAADRAVQSPEEAAQIARRICAATRFQEPRFALTLAAAEAACGRFPAAVGACRCALAAAPPEQAAAIIERLREYAAHRVWNDTPDVSRGDAERLHDAFLSLGGAASDARTAAAELAWILATHDDPRVRDPAEALRLAERGCRGPGGGTAAGFDARAAALAAAGDFDAATVCAEKALQQARAAGDADHVAQVEARLAAYAARIAWRETAAAPQAVVEELSRGPLPAAALCVWGRKALARGHAAAGLAALRLAADWFPTRRGLQRLAADAHRERGRYSDAADWYSAALAIEPVNGGAAADAEVHGSLAVCLVQLGRLEQAWTLFERALEHAPENAALRTNYGLALLAAGRAREALTQWRRALDADPTQALAANNLAWTLATHADAKLRDGREAVRLAVRLCQNRTTRSPAFLDTLAAAYAETGQFTQAAQVLRDLAAEWPAATPVGAGLRLRLYEARRPYRDAGRAHQDLAEEAFAWGRFHVASADLFQALLLDRADVRVRWRLAASLAQEGKFEHAKQHFQAALQLDPANARLHGDFGAALAARGDTREAVAALRTALRLDPELLEPANNLAWLLATGQPDAEEQSEALRWATRVCARDGGRNPIYLATLAAAYEACGRAVEARQTLAQALDQAESFGPREIVPDLKRRLTRLGGEPRAPR